MDVEKMENLINTVDQQILDSEKSVGNTDKVTDNSINNSTSNNPDLSIKEKYPNLITFNDLTEEEQRAIASKGGKKSGEVRRKRKQASQLLADILGRSLSNEQIDEILGDAQSLLGGDKSAYNVMLIKMLQCAMSGDVKAMQLVRDTVGDKPIEEIKQTTITQEDIKAIEDVKKRLMG